MADVKCKNCGGRVAFDKAQGCFVCQFCDTKQSLLSLDDGDGMIDFEGTEITSETVEAYNRALKMMSVAASITEIENIFYGTDNKCNVAFVKDEYGRFVYDDYGRKITKTTWYDAESDEVPENLTIYCEPGSAAMKYARDNGINCAKAEY